MRLSKVEKKFVKGKQSSRPCIGKYNSSGHPTPVNSIKHIPIFLFYQILKGKGRNRDLGVLCRCVGADAQEEMPIEAEIYCGSTNCDVKIESSRSGKFQCSFVPPIEGYYRVNVSSIGQQLKNSPLSIQVRRLVTTLKYKPNTILEAKNLIPFISHVLILFPWKMVIWAKSSLSSGLLYI